MRETLITKQKKINETKSIYISDRLY